MMNFCTLESYQREEKQLTKLISAGGDYSLKLKKLCKAAFNAAANARYLKLSKKTYEELDNAGYFSYGCNSWADGCSGDEWQDVSEAWGCGEEAADQALDEEEEEND